MTKQKSKTKKSEPETAFVPLVWETVQVRVNDLVPTHDNPRKISEAKMAKLIELLQRYNVIDIPAIDHDGELLKWNQRLKAMQAVGRGEELIDVRKPNRKLTERERKDIVLLDNQHFGEWDADMLEEFTADMDLGEIGLDTVDFMSFEERVEDVAAKKKAKRLEAQEDDGPGALPDAGVTVRGDVWELVSVEKGLRHRVMCGDSTVVDDVEKLLDGAKPTLMVTDPPYGVEYEAEWRNEAFEDGAERATGEVSNDDNADWTEAYFLSPAVVAYVWHADRFASIVSKGLEDSSFEIRNQIIWAKSNFAISRGHYHWQHEPCWYAVKKGKTAAWIGDRSQTTLWNIAKPMKSETGHGTQKPVECMSRPMANHSGDVHDPFLGSGTTLVAAEQYERTCYGMELSEKYCDVTVRRWLAWMEKEGLEYEVLLNGEAAGERVAQLKEQG